MPTQTQVQVDKTLAAPAMMQAACSSANFSFASAGNANIGGAGSIEEIARGTVDNPKGDVEMEQAFSEVPDSAIRKKLQFVSG